MKAQSIAYRIRANLYICTQDYATDTAVMEPYCAKVQAHYKKIRVGVGIHKSGMFTRILSVLGAVLSDSIKNAVTITHANC